MLEQFAQEGDVAQDRNLGDGVDLSFAVQAADDDRPLVGHGNAGLDFAVRLRRRHVGAGRVTGERIHSGCDVQRQEVAFADGRLDLQRSSRVDILLESDCRGRGIQGRQLGDRLLVEGLDVALLVVVDQQAGLAEHAGVAAGLDHSHQGQDDIIFDPDQVAAGAEGTRQDAQFGGRVAGREAELGGPAGLVAAIDFAHDFGGFQFEADVRIVALGDLNQRAFQQHLRQASVEVLYDSIDLLMLRGGGLDQDRVGRLEGHNDRRSLGAGDRGPGSRINGPGFHDFLEHVGDARLLAVGVGNHRAMLQRIDADFTLIRWFLVDPLQKFLDGRVLFLGGADQQRVGVFEGGHSRQGAAPADISSADGRSPGGGSASSDRPRRPASRRSGVKLHSSDAQLLDDPHGIAGRQVLDLVLLHGLEENHRHVVNGQYLLEPVQFLGRADQDQAVGPQIDVDKGRLLFLGGHSLPDDSGGVADGLSGGHGAGFLLDSCGQDVVELVGHVGSPGVLQFYDPDLDPGRLNVDQLDQGSKLFHAFLGLDDLHQALVGQGDDLAVVAQERRQDDLNVLRVGVLQADGLCGDGLAQQLPGLLVGLQQAGPLGGLARRDDQYPVAFGQGDHAEPGDVQGVLEKIVEFADANSLVGLDGDRPAEGVVVDELHTEFLADVLDEDLDVHVVRQRQVERFVHVDRLFFIRGRFLLGCRPLGGRRLSGRGLLRPGGPGGGQQRGGHCREQQGLDKSG